MPERNSVLQLRCSSGVLPRSLQLQPLIKHSLTRCGSQPACNTPQHEVHQLFECIPVRLNKSARALSQQPHKLGRVAAARSSQLLILGQRQGVHWSASEGAGHTQREMKARGQRIASWVAELQQHKRAVKALDRREQRQRQLRQGQRRHFLRNKLNVSILHRFAAAPSSYVGHA